MAENTKIEWADATVNHWAGCTKVSPAACSTAARTMDSRPLRTRRRPDHDRP